MKALEETIKVVTGLFLVLIVSIVSAKESTHLKPFRVAVIIGDQWKDPSGYVVAMPDPTGEFSGYGPAPQVSGDTDFHHLTVLLKSWGIPFDIIRLDQQFLDRNMFVDMYDQPKYGTIIWDVNKSGNLLHPDYSIMTEMVQNYGISMIALSDRIYEPEIQSLLGLKYIGGWESNTKMEVKVSHFLTRGLNPVFNIDDGYDGHKQRQKVELLTGTKTMVEQEGIPQVTIREYPSGARNVWIGSDHNYLFYFQDIRKLLRNAITWTIGYNLYKTYENEMIMIMDDPGTSQNAYLEHWHYPALTEEVIDKYLIKPLKENNAVLNVNFVPGFVDDKKGITVPTWTQQFVDSFGVKQDYASAKRGYDKGVKQGVFEVLCHGLTHMQPDLVSAPGWYGSPMKEEKAEVGWYREFGDTRRHKEIPAAEQLWRMTTARTWIIEQFGVEPLEFCAGGGGMSVSDHNNTVKLAGRAGFGWCGWNVGYLGKDMVISGWLFSGRESPLIIGSLPNSHDFGMTYAPDDFIKIFQKYPNEKFMSINEFIGYIHAGNSGKWKNGKELDLTIDYDPHYCRYFENRPTTWSLEFADWLTEQVGDKPNIMVDGEKVELTKLCIPAGIGTHTIEVKF